jgi:hypothetical protein
MGNLILHAVTDTGDVEIHENVAWIAGRIYFIKTADASAASMDTLDMFVTVHDTEKYPDTNGVANLSLPKVMELGGEYYYSFPSDMVKMFGGGANLIWDVQYAGDTNFTQDQKDQIQDACDRWSEVILEDRTIDLTVGYIPSNLQAPSGILAGAAPTAFDDSGRYLPTEGVMQIDPEDIGPNSQLQLDAVVIGDKTEFYYTVLHELGHVLGIGPLWNKPNSSTSPPFPQDLITSRQLVFDGNSGAPIDVKDHSDWPSVNPVYKGVHGVAAYNEITGLDVDALPVEDTGITGTAGVHPEEDQFGRVYGGVSIPGLDRELMTGIADVGVAAPLSTITIGMAKDLGWQVDVSKADDFALPTPTPEKTPTPTPAPDPAPGDQLSDWLAFNATFKVDSDSENNNSILLFEDMSFDYNNFAFKEYTSSQGHYISANVFILKSSYSGSVADIYLGNTSSSDYSYSSNSSFDYLLEYDVSSNQLVNDGNNYAFLDSNSGPGFAAVIDSLATGNTNAIIPNGQDFVDNSSFGWLDFDSWLDNDDIKLGIVLVDYDPVQGSDTILAEYKVDCSLEYADAPTPTPTPIPPPALSSWFNFDAANFYLHSDSVNETSYLELTNLVIDTQSIPQIVIDTMSSPSTAGQVRSGYVIVKDSFTGNLWDVWNGDQDYSQYFAYAENLYKFTTTSMSHLDYNTKAAFYENFASYESGENYGAGISSSDEQTQYAAWKSGADVKLAFVLGMYDSNYNNFTLLYSQKFDLNVSAYVAPPTPTPERTPTPTPTPTPLPATAYNIYDNGTVYCMWNSALQKIKFSSSQTNWNEVTLDPDYFIYKENAYSCFFDLGFAIKFTDENKNPISELMVWPTSGWSNVTNGSVSNDPSSAISNFVILGMHGDIGSISIVNAETNEFVAINILRYSDTANVGPHAPLPALPTPTPTPINYCSVLESQGEEPYVAVFKAQTVSYIVYPVFHKTQVDQFDPYRTGFGPGSRGGNEDILPLDSIAMYWLNATGTPWPAFNGETASSSGSNSWSGWNDSLGEEVRNEHDFYVLNPTISSLSCDGQDLNITEGNSIPSDVTYNVHPMSLTNLTTPSPTIHHVPTPTPTIHHVPTPTPTIHHVPTPTPAPLGASDLAPWMSMSSSTFDYDATDPVNNHVYFTFADMVIDRGQMISDLYPNGMQSGEGVSVQLHLVDKDAVSGYTHSNYGALSSPSLSNKQIFSTTGTTYLNADRIHWNYGASYRLDFDGNGALTAPTAHAKSSSISVDPTGYDNLKLVVNVQYWPAGQYGPEYQGKVFELDITKAYWPEVETTPTPTPQPTPTPTPTPVLEVPNPPTGLYAQYHTIGDDEMTLDFRRVGGISVTEWELVYATDGSSASLDTNADWPTAVTLNIMWGDTTVTTSWADGEYHRYTITLQSPYNVTSTFIHYKVRAKNDDGWSAWSAYYGDYYEGTPTPIPMATPTPTPVLDPCQLVGDPYRLVLNYVDGGSLNENDEKLIYPLYTKAQVESLISNPLSVTNTSGDDTFIPLRYLSPVSSDVNGTMTHEIFDWNSTTTSAGLHLVDNDQWHSWLTPVGDEFYFYNWDKHPSKSYCEITFTYSNNTTEVIDRARVVDPSLTNEIHSAFTEHSVSQGIQDPPDPTPTPTLTPFPYVSVPGTDLPGAGNGLTTNLTGDTIAVTFSPQYSSPGVVAENYIKVFRESSGTWTQLGQTLTSGDISNMQYQCREMSSDGNRILISSPQGTSSYDDGYVDVYEYNSSNNTWEQLGQTLSTGIENEAFGQNVSMSSDGNVVAVNTGRIGQSVANNNLANETALRVWSWSGSQWVRKGSDITGLQRPYGIGGIGQQIDNGLVGEGGLVALNADGTRMACVALIDHSQDLTLTNGNTIRIYDWSGSAWSEVGTINKTPTGSSHDTFHGALKFNADGTILLAGDMWTKDFGIYYDNNGTWELEGYFQPTERYQGNGSAGYYADITATGSRVAFYYKDYSPYDDDNTWFTVCSWDKDADPSLIMTRELLGEEDLPVELHVTRLATANGLFVLSGDGSRLIITAGLPTHVTVDPGDGVRVIELDPVI